MLRLAAVVVMAATDSRVVRVVLGVPGAHSWGATLTAQLAAQEGWVDKVVVEVPEAAALGGPQQPSHGLVGHSRSMTVPT